MFLSVSPNRGNFHLTDVIHATKDKTQHTPESKMRVFVAWEDLSALVFVATMNQVSAVLSLCCMQRQLNAIK